MDTGHGHVKPKAPKLPDIYDVKDEINSTIFQFERYAVAKNLVESEWALMCSLRRKSFRCVSSYAQRDDALNYQALKTALIRMKRFRSTT